MAKFLCKASVISIIRGMAVGLDPHAGNIGHPLVPAAGPVDADATDYWASWNLGRRQDRVETGLSTLIGNGDVVMYSDDKPNYEILSENNLQRKVD